MQHIHEAEARGERILFELSGQDEQLQRIGAHQKSINAALNVSERQLSYMESFRAFLFGVPGAERSPPEEISASSKDEADDHVWQVLDAVGDNAQEVHLGDDDDEDRLRGGLRRLRRIALKVGDTLDTQNQQLADMTRAVDATRGRMDRAATRVDNLLD